MSRSRLGVGVLLSGAGRTLDNLLAKRANDNIPVDVAFVASDRPTAKGLQTAADAGIPTMKLDPKADTWADAVYDRARNEKLDALLLCGFMRFLPIPEDFENRVVNIHPSLIPAFCGKGFYGSRVHKAVLEYGAKMSGCTVHFVDNEYDHGPIIAQQAVEVAHDDDPEALAARVFAAECELYPRVIAAMAAGKVRVSGRRVEVLP